MLSLSIPIYPYSKEIVEITNECLERVQKYTVGEYELCLVINGGDYKDLLVIPKGAKTVYFKEPIGNPKGWNEGYKLATGDVICFMDNDIWVEERWDVGLTERIGNIGVGIVTPKVFRKNGDGWDFIDDNFQGCCIVIQRETLDMLEKNPPENVPPCYGFDERFSPAYAEDTDLFLRCRLSGLDRQRVDGSTVLHHSGATCYNIFNDIEDIAKPSRAAFEDKWRHLGTDENGNLKAWSLWG